MLLLRALLLEFLVVFHVVGAAVLFRRLWPRESPWLAYILPTLGVMAVFNFGEHFIPFQTLAFLLPVTIVGLGWSLIRPGYSWEGLRLPTGIFIFVFTWCLAIKCLNPEITNNTEGVADMARVLDFSLGSTLPATDVWCPPYDHGGYYTFQHYGASLLKRLFNLDIGTGYNMGYTLLNTLTCLVGAGAAYRMSGNRTWVAIATLVVLLANFTGSAVFLVFRDWSSPDFQLAINIGDPWNGKDLRNDMVRNPFYWVYNYQWTFTGDILDPVKWVDPYGPQVLRLFTCTFNTYFPEFHANLGGHFMTILTLLAANEAFRIERTNLPWICLLLIPFLTLLTATWFFIIVTVLCVGCLVTCLISGRRPQNLRYVLLGTALFAILLWPSVDTLISGAGSYPVPFKFTPWLEYTPMGEFVIQWWPVWLPWLILCFMWRQMNLLARWIFIAVPVLLLFVEACTFADRGLTVEKMWGALYSTGLVTFLPIIFSNRNLALRLFTVAYLLISSVMVVAWVKQVTHDVYWQAMAFHLKGDTVFQNSPQFKRLLQVLKGQRGITILPGKCVWSYNMAPSIIGFSENRCFMAWFAQEYQCGHGGEAEYRNQMINDFYDGKNADPLPFLRANDIQAVLIWPEDAISDELLAQFKKQLGPDFFYKDCKEGGPNNCGLFVKQR